MDVSKDSVVIFDGWDEIPEYKLQGFVYAIAPLIQQSYKVIITSRYNPAASAKSDEEKSLFSDFDVAEICPFSKEQVATITGDLLDTDSRFYELLSNTMYLTMYLDLTNEERTAIFGVENAYQFIHSYFKLLFAKKHQKINNIDKIFCDAGEQIYCALMNEDSSFASNINNISVLNNIIAEFEDEDGNWRINTNHFRYKTFCLAAYLKTKLIKTFRDVSKPVSEALSSHKYKGNFIEALIFLGESLDDKQIESLKTLISCSQSDCLVHNLLYVLLGANHQCFDDDVFGITDEDLNS